MPAPVTSTAPTVPARVATAASGFGTRVSSGARSAYQYVTGQGLTTLLVVVVAVGVFAALAFTVYQILSTNLKVVTLLDEPVHALSQPKTVADKLPTMKNGKEFSLSFWVYVESQTNTSGLKKVLCVGDNAESYSPMVMMDRTTNKMYVALRTMTSQGKTKDALDTYSTRISDETIDYNDFVILEVEYVPLARWINLVVVLDKERRVSQ